MGSMHECVFVNVWIYVMSGLSNELFVGPYGGFGIHTSAIEHVPRGLAHIPR